MPRTCEYPTASLEAQALTRQAYSFSCSLSCAPVSHSHASFPHPVVPVYQVRQLPNHPRQTEDWIA
ncbi:hypothetical protein SCLCIDRAFT_1215321, partial [Scleroderma citrinum Foug A]